MNIEIIAKIDGEVEHGVKISESALENMDQDMLLDEAMFFLKEDIRESINNE